MRHALRKHRVKSVQPVEPDTPAGVPERRNRFKRTAAAVLGVATMAGSLLIIPLSGSASASGQNCDGNAYVSEVLVQDYTGGQFAIEAIPASNTRYATWSLFHDYQTEATNEIWHAVQACVPGLYGGLADSIYQQIACHVFGTLSGPGHAGGDEFGFESWRGTTDLNTALRSGCNWGGWPYSAIGAEYRPDRPGNNPTF